MYERKGVGEAGRAVVCAEYDLILLKLEFKINLLNNRFKHHFNGKGSTFTRSSA